MKHLPWNSSKAVLSFPVDHHNYPIFLSKILLMMYFLKKEMDEINFKNN